VRLILELLIVAVLAAGIGLGLTGWAVKHPPMFDAVRSGPWSTDPKIGTVDVDLYALAVVARRGEAPLAVGDGLSFTAKRDSEGRKLRQNCTYVVSGATPAARAWTLFVSGAKTPAAPDLRRDFTNAELTHDSNGHFRVAVSSEVQPGDWLPLGAGDGRFSLVLAIYDTTLDALTGGHSVPDLPEIERTGCR
jgi:hypothetical protein